MVKKQATMSHGFGILVFATRCSSEAPLYTGKCYCLIETPSHYDLNITLQLTHYPTNKNKIILAPVAWWVPVALFYIISYTFSVFKWPFLRENQ